MQIDSSFTDLCTQTTPFILQVSTTSGTARDGDYIAPLFDVSQFNGQAVNFNESINSAQDFILSPEGYLTLYGTASVLNLQSGLHYGSASFNSLSDFEDGVAVAGAPFVCSITSAKTLSCNEGGVNHFYYFDPIFTALSGIAVGTSSYVSSNSFYQPITLNVIYV